MEPWMVDGVPNESGCSRQWMREDVEESVPHSPTNNGASHDDLL